jgi:hypothetical protein
MPSAKKFFGAVRNFFKVLLGKWREVIGWMTIIVFAYLYVYQANSAWWLKGRTYAFAFLFSITVLILYWLKANSKKQ